LIVKWVSAQAVSKLFGDGFVADLAGRGTVYLADEVRKSINRDDEQITRVRLRPGEQYTVIARPRATRRERKLAGAQRGLQRRYQQLSRPSRSQLRTARGLARAQRKLAKTSPESRRYAARAARERELGLRFDRRMRPSKQLLKVATALDATTKELDTSRASSLEDARSARGRRRRRTRVAVYD
jgi:hypothetical protein